MKPRNPQPTTVKPIAQPTPELLIDSKELFQNGTTVHIEHAGQRYTLRITRENKLILTK